MKKIFLIISLLISVNLFADLVADGKEAYKSENYEKAIKLFTKACDNNNYEGCRMLGKTYKDKFDNLKKGIVFYKKACDRGYAKACFHMGTFYSIFGIDERIKYFEKACDLGASIGCKRASQKNLDIAHKINQTEENKKKFIKEAKRLIKKAKEVDTQNCKNGTLDDCIKIYKYELPLTKNQYTDDVVVSRIKFFNERCNTFFSYTSCIRLGVLEYKFNKPNNAIKAFKKACDGGDNTGCIFYKKLTEK